MYQALSFSFWQVLEEDVERISHKNVPDAKDAFCCTVEVSFDCVITHKNYRYY